MAVDAEQDGASKIAKYGNRTVNPRQWIVCIAVNKQKFSAIRCGVYPFARNAYIAECCIDIFVQHVIVIAGDQCLTQLSLRCNRTKDY